MDAHALKPGDKLRDNDPRMNGRIVTITALGLSSTEGLLNVMAKRGPGFPEVRISTKRIFTDGRPRRYGFNKINSEA